MMRGYTTVEQSKKLAEILPIESTDMVWIDYGYCKRILPKDDVDATTYPIITSAWSLPALLDVYPMVVGRDLDMYCCWQNNKNLHSKHYDNPVDACVEMILKLHEQIIEDFNKEE